MWGREGRGWGRQASKEEGETVQAQRGHAEGGAGPKHQGTSKERYPQRHKSQVEPGLGS